MCTQVRRDGRLTSACKDWRLSWSSGFATIVFSLECIWTCAPASTKVIVEHKCSTIHTFKSAILRDCLKNEKKIIFYPQKLFTRLYYYMNDYLLHKLFFIDF